ncbi:helix-turn-helix transcriptional regulator [Actinoplanes sp. TFC3]|uniref:helix-turn-helix domain-containing protein n=1 Tax=Actinoplanes sp. TFC3 TaxID=1710355 RepID=UPI000834F1E3|nr:helix-turn-helix transcriptional regulator [Actinoplanes sp. TFC3]
MDRDPGSTVPRRQLGRFLRAQREAGGSTVKAAADHLECSVQKIWRIEKGAVPVRSADVRALCQFYATAPEVTEVLTGLSKETKAKGWWQSYGDAVPDWFELYVGLEAAATRIRKFEPSVVPGLLQAHAYMEAVIVADQPQLTADEVDQRIRIKQQRQGLLTRHFPPPPTLEVIVWQSALLAAPHTPGAMQQQLWHLLKGNELPHVSVRVLPLAVGPHRASVTGPFTILDFGGDYGSGDEPSTVYSESLTGALYLDKPHELAVYDGVWSALAEAALSAADSGSLIREALEEMSIHA